MGHRIKDDVYTEWESFFLGELEKIIFVFALSLPAIPQIGVLAHHDHDAAFVVENGFVMGHLGILAFPGDAGPLAVYPNRHIGDLRYLSNIEHAMEQRM